MSRLSLSEWLDALQSQHPTEIDLGLDRVSAVADAMGLLTLPPTTITVAGTNGKGTVVSVLSRVLSYSGLCVGRYMSPHLVRFNERVCINDREVEDAGLVAAFEAIEQARGDVSLTYFEAATLAALYTFRAHQVDVQILEVGLGGRLDAVNILDADLTVITSIGLDHTDWLGDDRSQIALEKAGVVRGGQPCVVAEPDPPPSLAAHLTSVGAEVSWINEDWRAEPNRVHTSGGETYGVSPPTGLLPQNVGAAVEALSRLSDFSLSQALLEPISSISVPGRLSRHRFEGKDVLLDVAHNAESVAQLSQYLSDHPVAGKTRALFGVMGDKPIRDMIHHCSAVIHEWNLIDLSHVPRAMAPQDVSSLLQGEQVVDMGIFSDLWPRVRARMAEHDRMVVFGSFFSVGEALAMMDAGSKNGD